MKRFINFFFFSRRERLGSVVLLVLCVGVFSVPNIRERFQISGNTDFSQFEHQITAFKAAEPHDSLPDAAPELFHFDPNLASESDFTRLGLSPKVATSICHYREKGGKFREPDDFKKIWGLTAEDFERLRPFIRIRETDNHRYAKSGDDEERPVGAWGSKYPERKFQEYPHKRSPEVVDINSADQEAWMALPMIGEKRAVQIIRFRESLGGFLSVDQLGEMYNLPDSVFQTIKPYLKFQNPVFRKINLNSATLEMLDAHPYISRKQAELIANYREQHGAFHSVEEVLNIRAFHDDDWWKKVRPYLSVEPE